MEGPDSQEDGSSSRGSSSRRSSAKKPMKFMFIDSSNQGQNAKPDKTVRSFVMHQARRSRPWSTRQKGSQKTPPSPTKETVDTRGPKSKRSASQAADHEAEDHSTGSRSSWPGSEQSEAWHVSLESPISAVSSGSSSRSGSQPCITPPSSHGNVCDMPYCSGSCGNIHTALARRDGFALGVMDPFESLPVRLDARSSALIDHFVNIISPRLIPLDLHQTSKAVTSNWIANSIRDVTSAPFTYTLLTTSALHLKEMGAENVGDAWYYKAQAISGINKLLSDPTTMTDDHNIAAVFMLLCLEESQLAPGNKAHDDTEWSETQRAIHLNGLRTMIQQRGGLAALRSNRCLQIFLLMHSIAHSIASFQQPYTTLLDSTGAPQKYDMPSFRSRPSSARVLRLFRDVKPDADLFEIISDVVVYVGDMSSWYEDQRCPLDPLELQKHASLLMYRLFDWYSKEGEDERNPLDQSVCLGLLIFLGRAASPFDPSYKAVILMTVKKLRAALTKGSIFRWAKSPDLLLWILTVGALAAQGTSESGFFVQYCSVAFADAGFDEKTSTDELLGRMKKCLWIPVLFDEDVKKLWIQMGLAKGEEEVGDIDIDAGLVSPDIKEDDVVGMLTSTRFFKNK